MVSAWVRYRILLFYSRTIPRSMVVTHGHGVSPHLSCSINSFWDFDNFSLVQRMVCCSSSSNQNRNNLVPTAKEYGWDTFRKSYIIAHYYLRELSGGITWNEGRRLCQGLRRLSRATEAEAFSLPPTRLLKYSSFHLHIIILHFEKLRSMVSDRC